MFTLLLWFWMVNKSYEWKTILQNICGYFDFALVKNDSIEKSLLFVVFFPLCSTLLAENSKQPHTHIERMVLISNLCSYIYYMRWHIEICGMENILRQTRSNLDKLEFSCERVCVYVFIFSPLLVLTTDILRMYHILAPPLLRCSGSAQTILLLLLFNLLSFFLSKHMH